MLNIGIIGGGAAGLMAGAILSTGICCSRTSPEVSWQILESGPSCGRKLLLTGHGRCNITNLKEPKLLAQGYHEAEKFIYPALCAFTPEMTVAFYKNHLGIKLKEEENNRIFPATDKAQTIKDALADACGSTNIITDFEVAGITANNPGFTVLSSDGRKMEYDRVILATGGKTFPQTGSTGSGYSIAKSLGLEVTPLTPALTGIHTDGADKELTSALSGVTVNASSSLYLDGRKTASFEGNVLFTHQGLSGPSVTGLARYIPSDVRERGGFIEIDLIPDLDDSALDKKITSQVASRPKLSLVNLLSEFVPRSVAEALIIRTCGELTNITLSTLPKNLRKNLVQELKHLRITIPRRPPFENAYVTRGGVSLREVRRTSYESVKVPGLYIIGELLDIDGISGGYNLQAAMSEAYLAVRDMLS